MESRITVITFGVINLERSVKFYQNLGFITPGIIGTEFENGAVAFFDLQNGLKLGLWPKKSIAVDTGLPLSAASALEFTIGHNVQSPEEVDELMKLAGDVGATIVKPACDTFYGGYAGYFQDPDGHLWEVVWNQGF